jgi:sporulation protein YlmC with PRC-barrel domain
MEKISKILGTKVVNEEGMYLGRVLELRSDGDPEHGLPNKNRPITELAYGPNGVLQFLGLPGTHVKIVPWTAVKTYSRRQVVIKTSEIE